MGVVLAWDVVGVGCSRREIPHNGSYVGFSYVNSPVLQYLRPRIAGHFGIKLEEYLDRWL